jgi:hypothetical protein
MHFLRRVRSPGWSVIVVAAAVAGTGFAASRPPGRPAARLSSGPLSLLRLAGF